MMTNLDNARAQSEALATATGKNLGLAGRCSEELYFARLNADLTARLRAHGECSTTGRELRNMMIPGEARPQMTAPFYRSNAS